MTVQQIMRKQLPLLVGWLAACHSTSPSNSPPLPERWAQVTSGGFHSCALSVGGEAYCWGSNGYGQLGDSAASGPSAVLGGYHWTQLAAGGNFTCGIRDDGHTWCWGNSRVQEAANPVPRPVPGDPGFTQISAGVSHVCGTLKSGEGYCWGANGRGQLGVGSDAFGDQPKAVVGGISFSVLAPGDNQTCGLSLNGQTYCWGGSAVIITSPQLVPDAPGLTTLAIGGEFGRYHLCGDSGTELICFGYNHSGELGRGIVSTGDPSFFEPPARVLAPTGVELRAAASNAATDPFLEDASHTCAVGTDHSVYCWGSNGFGQLGDGTTTQRTTPTLVAGKLSFVTVGLGSAHTCGLTTEGQVYCWGNGRYGQLGLGAPSGTIFSAVPLPAFGNR